MRNLEEKKHHIYPALAPVQMLFINRDKARH